MTKLSYVWSLAFVLGLIAAYIGERIVGAGSARGILTGVGVLLVLVTLTGRVGRMARSSGDRRRIERYLLVFQFLGLFALLLYFGHPVLWLRVPSKMLKKTWP